MTEAAQQRVICVIGMHRSGTSCLTGSLQQGGLDLGKHSTWNRFNEKGNRENQDFVDFHEQLLADNKASWDKPPKRIHFDESHRRAAQQIIDGFAQSPLWGFKDPRSTLALSIWQELIPQLQLIGIFRHPLAVVQSLRRRAGHGISTRQGMSLWYHYNQILYREYRCRPFPLLCFDWDEERFHEQLNLIHKQLKLKPLEPGQRFYTADLQNFSAQETAGLPWRVRRLYKKLRGLVENA